MDDAEGGCAGSIGAARREEGGDRMRYDLLLKGGTVIDPAQVVHAVKDVAFADGRVAAVCDDLPRGEAAEVVDCSIGWSPPE